MFSFKFHFQTRECQDMSYSCMNAQRDLTPITPEIIENRRIAQVIAAHQIAQIIGGRQNAPNGFSAEPETTETPTTTTTTITSTTATEATTSDAVSALNVTSEVLVLKPGEMIRT